MEVRLFDSYMMYRLLSKMFVLLIFSGLEMAYIHDCVKIFSTKNF